MKSTKQRQAEFKQRKLDSGRERKCFYLTKHEWLAVKAFIQQIQKQEKQKWPDTNLTSLKR